MFLRSLTTEAMGIWRFAGASLSPSDKVNAGAKAAVGVLPNPALQYVLRYLCETSDYLVRNTCRLVACNYYDLC